MSGIIAVAAVSLYIVFDPRTQEWLGFELAAASAALGAFGSGVASFFASLFRR